MPDRKPALHPGPHYALQLLASAPEGYAAPVLEAYGVSLEVVADLADAGLVTMDERVLGGDRPTKVTRVRITDGGRAALGK